jgi:hypothetical protein
MLLRAGVLLASVLGLSADSVTLQVSQYVNANRMQAFRARWKDDYSEPVRWRVPPAMQVARVSGTRKWVVHVFPATPTGEVALKGKRVELQRLAPSGWVRVRSAKLVRRASLRWGAFNHQATFTIPTRKLRLRAFLPEASAAPCYLPGGSAPWRS